jgi:hypothetical protein
MDTKIKILMVVSLLAGAVLSSYRGASAHELTCQEQLSQSISARFNLNQNEVKSWMDSHFRDYGYNCSLSNSQDINTRVRNDHLTFIDIRLTNAVNKGKLTEVQKDKIIAKLKEKMATGSSAEQYVKMTNRQRQTSINQWRIEMEQWGKENGISLSKIRNITGKGNKYLMGMEI